MGIRDRNIDWKRQKKVIPWQEFGVMSSNGAGNTIASVGNGAPVANHISNFFLTGISIEDDDAVAAWDFNTPSLMDPTEEIGVRVLYTIDEASPTATDDVTWTVLYDQVDPGEAIIKPATALNTVIAAQEDGGTTGYLYRVSSRGVISADTMDFTAKTGIMSWMVTGTVVNAYDTGVVTFLGLEVDYKPLLCVSTEETEVVYKDIAATN